jgi:hypothetical protein
VGITSLVVSTVAFFASSYFIKRWADENDIPKGMTRSVSIFTAALLLSYMVGWLVDKVLA